VKKKKLTIRLDPEVSKKLQIYCLEHNTTAQKLIEKYIKQLLQIQED
jgi:predicted transcriptional regulator